jgi:hypothetical protein
MLAIARNQQALARELSDLYSVYAEGDTTEHEIKTFQCLNPTKQGVYLNYGSGQWSQSLERLRQDGYQIFGFEPFVSTSDSSYVIRSMTQLSHMRFDGIMSHNVLEHLPDPVGTLSFLASLLATDKALMAHSTPCYRYEVEFTRFHLFFYTGRSLQLIGDKCGLNINDTADPDIKLYTRRKHSMPKAAQSHSDFGRTALAGTPTTVL